MACIGRILCDIYPPDRRRPLSIENLDDSSPYARLRSPITWDPLQRTASSPTQDKLIDLYHRQNNIPFPDDHLPTPVQHQLPIETILTGQKHWPKTIITVQFTSQLPHIVHVRL